MRTYECICVRACVFILFAIIFIYRTNGMISIKFQYAAFCHLYFHEREKKLLIKQRENLIARRNVTYDLS